MVMHTRRLVIHLNLERLENHLVKIHKLSLINLRIAIQQQQMDSSIQLKTPLQTRSIYKRHLKNKEDNLKTTLKKIQNKT